MIAIALARLIRVEILAVTLSLRTNLTDREHASAPKALEITFTLVK